jgi:hypothetical protein
MNNRLDTVHVSWKSVDEAIKRASKMITDHERFLSEVKRNSGQGLQGVRNEYKSLEVCSLNYLFIFLLFVFFIQNFKRTLDDDGKDIQQVTDSYSEIVRAYPAADVSGEIRARIKELNTRWETLNGALHETMKNV